MSDREGIDEVMIEALDGAEEAAVEQEAGAFRSTLSELQRKTASIRRYLAPQCDALDRLYRQPGDLFSHSEAQSLREEADRITRYLLSLEAVDLRSPGADRSRCYFGRLGGRVK